MKSLGKLMALSLILGLSHCGKDKDQDKTQPSQQVNGNPLSLLDAGTLMVSGKQIKGTGKLIFQSPLKSNDNHFAMALKLKDKSFMDLTANSDKNLTNGVTLRFLREQSSLKVTLLAHGKSIDISERFTAVDASTSMNIFADIHNGENPTHVLIWADGSEFSEEKALFNSEEHGATPGQGQGKFWGFELKNAEITSPLVAEPKFSED